MRLQRRNIVTSSTQPSKGDTAAWRYKPAVIHKDFRQGPETFADPKKSAPGTDVVLRYDWMIPERDLVCELALHP